MKKVFSSKSLFPRSFNSLFQKQFINTQKVLFCHHQGGDKSKCPHEQYKQLNTSGCPYLNYQQLGYNLIRNKAPEFSGMAWWKSDFKKVSLSDFQGKWVCLFFYPLDFTFVCPTEIVDFNTADEEFNKLSNIPINLKTVKSSAALLTHISPTGNGLSSQGMKAALHP
jgi:hypothetical protein